MQDVKSVRYHICSQRKHPVPHGISENFYLSRRALITCLRQVAPDKDWNDGSVEIVNHHHMKKDTQWRVSLSHTKQAGAALLCHRDNSESVGIDIECSHRSLSFQAVRYFKNRLDDWDYNSREGVLWAWSLKEAAFKALSPLQEEQLLLKHIWINEKNFGLDSATLGTLKREYDPFLSLHIALAFVDSSKGRRRFLKT